MTSLKWAGAALFAALVIAAPASAQTGGGHDQTKRGSQLYVKHCALCHGAEGKGGAVFPKPIWGPGHGLGKFGTGKGLLDYLYLLMPFDDPNKVTDEEKLAIAAYMLVRNGSLQEGANFSPSEVAAIILK